MAALPPLLQTAATTIKGYLPLIAVATTAASLTPESIPIVATKMELAKLEKKTGESSETLIDTLARQGQTIKTLDIKLHEIGARAKNAEARAENAEVRAENVERRYNRCCKVAAVTCLIGLISLAPKCYQYYQQQDKI